MRHFHRTHILPDEVLAIADEMFAGLGLERTASTARTRAYRGDLGMLTLSVRPEGGHYTFIEANTDQVGESRLDRNVKRFFVGVHRAADPTHRLTASY
jgi:hypothetical protein